MFRKQAMLDEELGCPTPAELLKELVAVASFHDDPAAVRAAAAAADGGDNAALDGNGAAAAGEPWDYRAMASLPDEDFEEFEEDDVAPMSMAGVDKQ